MTPEAKREYNRAYYAKNREKCIAKVQKHYVANKEAIAARSKPARQKYYENNKERIKAENAARDHLRKYGITLEHKAPLFLAQGSCCSICKSDAPGGAGQWHTDHCHETGAVRGVLCHGCNTGLGHFNDNPEALEAAAAYLRKQNEFIATDGPVSGPHESDRPLCQSVVSSNFH